MNQINQEAIALLWIIREYGPLSALDVMYRVYSAQLRQENPIIGEVLVNQLAPSRRNRVAHYIRQRRDGEETSGDFNRMFRESVLFFVLRSLLEANLIQVDDLEQSKIDDIAEHNTISVAASFSSLQQIFGLSLSTLIKNRQRNTIIAEPIFNPPLQHLSEQWSRIFVAMPFQEKLEPIFKEHILSVTHKLKLSCKRGDDFFSVNSIVDEIWSSIYHADLCIVECTGRNPNVFYELGIAHTLGRKTILIGQSINDVPFDIQHMRVIIYQFTPQGMREFEEKLRKTIINELRLDHEKND
ncbi:MAG: hypothetical protein K8L97_22075 [Anaerolineae bacterium]|nr:hypothetical protein [Anaerolineae bacterium]